MKGELQIRNAARLYAGVTTLDVPQASVREGMRITFGLLEEMHKTGVADNTEVTVAVIPTKERVFSDYLERDPTLPLSDVLLRLLANERLARERTFRFLTDSSIPFVDTLPALKRAAEHEPYARSAVDMHPSKHGYRVIAESINEGLRRAEGTR